eukprot:TRINITY_DN4325_c0_g1_i1.p1 TRINITY_DN4325_c0_g1~~TRINITY_DN4325_c0_g1_i1.p1  ORF type:complete len:509 (+),score=115.00 TRINITY_DN4325_c0_g1_i1:161-1687(+)
MVVSSEPSATNINPLNPPVVDEKYYYPDKSPDVREVATHGVDWMKESGWKIFITILIPACFLQTLIYFTGSADISTLYLQIHTAALDLAAEHPNKLYLVLGVTSAVFSMILLFVSLYIQKRKSPVYLMNFVAYQPPDNLKISNNWVPEASLKMGLPQESVEFLSKIGSRTGLGNETYLPAGVLAEPPAMTFQNAREEAELVLGGCLDELFHKTGITPQQIDILIVNCSLFNPTPSLAAMMVNKYKMRSDIKSYNLSGMGCSASVISIDLAKELLQNIPNAIAIVLSTENITLNWYQGTNKSMLVQNTLFRMGGAGIMLTNRSNLRHKYKMMCTVRVTKGADTAYQAVFQTADEEGNLGVRLAPAKELMGVVGDALKTNLAILGPMVLPWSEQIKFFLNLTMKKMGKKIPSYVPNFRLAFQHFCIHAGGRAIIDGLEQNLSLTKYDCEPSRATLYRYGNTSSSSIWYELNYIERQRNVKKGDKVWQIAVGSGFKCNSIVWVATRNIRHK